MRNPLRNILGRLRRFMSRKAETAIRERDAAPDGSNAESYAAGESHAYEVSAEEVRNAQTREDRGEKGA